MENTFLLDSSEKDKRCSKYHICNSKHFCHKSTVLLLTCLISFGSFFCYDNPAALQSMFIKDLNLSYELYMGLYAWYSWPNIIMSFLGGILIDNMLGIRLGTIIFGILTVIGQILLSIGVFLDKLWLMYFARFIFGIGAESMAVAQNTYAARWFKDKQLNVVFGLQVSISRIGSALNPNIMPNLYNKLHSSYDGCTSLTLSLLIASITCVFSLVFCIILGYLDFRAFKKLELYSNDEKQEINYKDILKFNYGVWSLCIVCLIFYASIFPFFSLAQTFFVQKYSISVLQANLANSFIYVVSAFTCPIIGFGVDLLGRNLIFLTSGLLFLLTSHILFAFTIEIQPYLLTIFMGFAYSIISSSLWGLIAYMVPRRKQGTAFGLMQAIMNFGLGVVALISGSLVDKYGYLCLELFFIVFVMISLCTLIILYHWNNQNMGILNLSAKKRRGLHYYL